ncbi:elongation factor Ts [Candidatus Roizmanbacteria bacterium CG_4_10_14_0_2_um_filter_39_13]|uniref:Elongation factor Ts n=1 Tax=Candidatus Roizmanbacteria bacterium CG_4_10_14_0_2_um_filter_39_13 TaxID=1974825 RepID=A0A2M7U030_9BACT|nr:MAG: elongation factor Ts [Candidatus Roizmanbacteria bacterium CG_4_10_14_0_2_um_filter_39_13]
MIDYSKLKQLRSETQVSFSLCKKALEESDNDIEKSMKLLKKWGIEKAEKKADRETKAGGLFSYIHHNKKIASLIELQSETDFVSGNDDFKKLGNEIAMQAASVRSDTLEEFLVQDYIRDPGKTIDNLIKDAILKFGENIKIARILRWELGE